ncbi:MAG: DHH family phosphoesterase, partial [Lachnospiraceae bacterium]|nr:DHH family phosphoesterase [Lachnospiraceae bacterium]
MNPEQLIYVLSGHRVFIQTHNYPDPDAIASAFGLQCFLRHFGIDAMICYDGSVERMSAKKMFKVFGIEAVAGEALTGMGSTDYIVLVDSQKFNANLTDFIGDEVACIDHHPTYFSCDYKYSDIRTVGACSSLIAEYFHATDTPLPSNVAAALAYGIKMDTDDFIRGATETDVDMFDYVFKLADKSMLREMYSNVMELSDLNAYSAAIENIRIYEDVGFAYIPFRCPDAMIAIISDFILSMEIVRVSVVYSSRPDGIKFSVRSEITDQVDAGQLIKEALKGCGDGGGHKQMAGGFMPESEKALGDRSEIEARFMELIYPGRSFPDPLTPE